MQSYNYLHRKPRKILFSVQKHTYPYGIIRYFKFRKFQTLHFQQRIKRIILIYHAARRCISLMPQAATNGIEWLHSAFVFIRCTLGCIVHCINSSYSKYWLRRAKGSLLKKASEPLARRSQTSIRCFKFPFNSPFNFIFNLRKLS